MTRQTPRGAPGVAIFGGAVFDRKYRARQPLVPGTSNPVDGSHSHGGVGRNVAENLARLGARVLFSTIVGNDATGDALIGHLDSVGVDTGRVMRTSVRPTAEYAAILDEHSELALGIADMAIFDLYGPEQLDRAWPATAAAEWVLADCNLPAQVLADLAARCRAAGKRLAANTVSAPKAVKLRGLLERIDLLFTNREEAGALLGNDAATAVECAEALRQAGAQTALVTAAAEGYALLADGAVDWYAAPPASPVDITGAGDSMVAGTLFRLLNGDGLADAARAGALLAARTTETSDSVLAELSPDFFARLVDAALVKG
ncbi:MAG: carbohydrate kinase [Rhizobiaceae bacterium]|nr:carbohydrate kinase [Rhizobiaceae bacterium]